MKRCLKSKVKKLQENNQNLSKHFFNSRFLDAIYLKSKKEELSFNSKFTRSR